VVQAISRSSPGKKLGEVLPHLSFTPLARVPLVPEPEEDFDVAFLCLPHQVSLETVPDLLSKGKRVIDLSGAYRIKDPQAYKEFYDFEHTHPDLLERAVYGLTELFRDSIRGADLVANPGCYPTATLLGLFPLLKEGLVSGRITVHAVSGVSGAGRSPKQQFHFPEMEGNFFVYSPEKHRHVPEMERVIKEVSGKDLKVRFTPTVVPSSRGMLVTVYAKTEPLDMRELFSETFRGEPFVRITDVPPMTGWVVGTNLCLIYPFYDRRTSTAVVVSVIDNLGKGASHQAVQNMNVMFGLEESEGLLRTPLFP
jgi:N-acetyl-gamma-glutamyl-phosphate reductase